MQERDEGCLRLIEAMSKSENRGMIDKHKGLLFLKEKQSEIWRLVVPEVIQETIVVSEHERIGHSGVFKTLSQVQKNFWCKSMSRDVKRRAIACDCQRVKHLNRSVEGQWVCEVR